MQELPPLLGPVQETEIGEGPGSRTLGTTRPGTMLARAAITATCGNNSRRRRPASANCAEQKGDRVSKSAHCTDVQITAQLESLSRFHFLRVRTRMDTFLDMRLRLPICLSARPARASEGQRGAAASDGQGGALNGRLIHLNLRGGGQSNLH